MKAVIDSNYSKNPVQEYSLVYKRYREVKRSNDGSKKLQEAAVHCVAAIEYRFKSSKNKECIFVERDFFHNIFPKKLSDTTIKKYIEQIADIYKIIRHNNYYEIIRNNIVLFPEKRSELNKSEETWDVINKSWHKILRSDDSSRFIQTKCLKIISLIEYFLSKANDDEIVITSDALKAKTSEISKTQRLVYLKQLADLYEIKHHKGILHKGIYCRNSYHIKRTKHCLEILNDPNLFYQKKEKTWGDRPINQNNNDNYLSLNCSLTNETRSLINETRSSLYYKNKEREEVDYNTACYNINAREEILAPEKVAIIPKELPQEIKKPSKTIFLIKDFMPLTQNDCSLLQMKSGREFTLNAMNEILKDLERRRGGTANFWHKDAFLAYFAKVLKQEKRDAVKTSSESFRIKTNLNEEEISERAIEKYLTEVEYSLEVSPEWHFKKKICSVLEPKSAYNFLKNYHKSEIEGTTFKIYLRNEIALRESEKNIILNQARASHEKVNIGSFEVTAIGDIQFIFYNKLPQQQTNIIKTMEPLKEDKKMLLDKKVARELKHVAPFCEFIEKGENKIAVRILEGIAFEDSTTERVKTCIKSIYGEDVTITRLRGVMNNENTASFRAANDNIADDSLLKQNIAVKSSLKQEFKKPEKKPDTKPQTSSRNNLNERFKTVLASQFFTNGAATVRNWFDRLAYDKTRSEEDKLVLVGECFAVDWIKNNYWLPLDKTAKKMNIGIEICYQGHGTPEILIKKIENDEK